MPNQYSQIERLKTMLGLEEKREVLQRQLDALDQQLSSLKDQLFDGAPAPATSPRAKAPPKAAAKPTAGRKGRNKRGALKEIILSALASAGDAGVRVTELAAKLGSKPANIHAWFHSTGKTVPGLVKVGGGHYRMKNGAAASAPAAKAPKPAKAAAPTAKKGRGRKASGGKRGGRSETILKELEAAGDEGIKIKDLANKIGAEYRNVSVWFATTGKKNPKIKKLGAAHYKLTA